MSNPSYQTVTLTNTSNQEIFGSGTTTTLTVPTPSASRTYTIPDAGSNVQFVMAGGTQTIGGNKTFSGTTTFSGNVTVNANETVNGTFAAAGTATFAGPTTLNNNTTLNGTTNINNTLNLNGTNNFPGTNNFTGTNNFSGTNSFTNLSSNSVLGLNSSKNVISSSILNGQVLMGTGSGFTSGTIQGTPGQINVATSSGTITISLSSSNPTYQYLNLTNTSNQLNLGTGDTITLNAPPPSSSVTYTLPDVATNANFVLTEGAQTINGNKTLSGTTKFSALNSSAGLVIDSSNNLSSVELLNGEFLIGQTSGVPQAGSLTSTNGDLVVTNGAGTIDLKLSNPLGPSSSPTFVSETLSGSTNQLTFNSGNTVTLNVPAPSSARIYTLSDVATNANFVLTEGNQTLNGNKTLSGTTNLSGLTAKSVLTLDSSKNVASTTLNSGQLLIGSTGSSPVAGSLTSSNGDLVIAGGAGSIDLSLSNPLGPTSSPSFVAETLTATTNQLTLGSGNTVKINAPTPASNVTYTIPDASANASFVLTEGNQTLNGNKTLSGTTNLSGLNSSSVLYLDSSKNVTSNALTNGQLLVGSTGANPVAATLQGASGEITVTNGSGSITLGLANPLSPSSSPTFASETLSNTSNQLVLGTTQTVTLNAPTPASSLTYTLPDVATNANIILSEGNQTLNGNKTLSGTTTLSGLSANAVLSLNGSKAVSGTNLTNGQLLIGSTGAAASAGNITSTNSSIVVSNGANTIDLAVNSNPTFASETLSNTANQLVLGTTNTITLNAPSPAASAVYTLPDVATNADIVLTAGDQAIGGNKTLSGTTTLSNSSNQLIFGTGNTIVINGASPAASVIYNIPDVGTGADFVLTEGGQTLNGNKTITGTTNFQSLLGSSTLYLDNSKNLVSRQLSDGQLIIGSTGNDPAYSTLTGTSDQIIVTGGAGSITLSTPQNISAASQPTFAAETLTNTSNQLVLGSSNTTTINAVSPAASVIYTIPDVAGNADFVLTTGTQTISGNKTLSGTTTLSGLTANSVLTLNSSDAITTKTLNNGQLLIGSTGSSPVVAGLTGTANQINVTSGAGSITLSTPQNINTSASPTFSVANLTNTTNQLILGGANTVTLNASAPAASRTYTIPDAGTNSNFVLTDGAQTINGNKTFTGTVITPTKRTALRETSNTQTFTNAATSTVLFTSSLSDTTGGAVSYNTTTGVFTVNETNTFTISPSVVWAANPTGIRSIVILTSQYGSKEFGAEQVAAAPTVSLTQYPTKQTTFAEIPLTSGSTFSVAGMQDNGLTTLNTTSASISVSLG